MKPIKIGKKKIGTGYGCYIIAEIGSNFDGSLSKAKKLIRLAKDSGADAAKFQSFVTEELISKKGFEKKSSFQKKWKKSVWEVYKNAELPRKWHKELSNYAKKIGIDFFTSPWDFEAVDLLVSLKAPVFKIGSGDITFIELLKYVGGKNKPILLATGSSNLQEVRNAVRAIKSTGNKKIILMHSVVQYPSKIEDANLRVLKTLEKEFDLNVGYSDHSSGNLISLSSVALGACVIEKHFTINSKGNGPDHPHSMEPREFQEMVKQIRVLEKALGDGLKIVKDNEKESRVIQRRGIWTTENISKGEKFSKKNLKALRPCLGISASEYCSVLGKRAKKNFKPYESLRKIDIQ